VRTCNDILDMTEKFWYHQIQNKKLIIWAKFYQGYAATLSKIKGAKHRTSEHESKVVQCIQQSGCNQYMLIMIGDQCRLREDKNCSFPVYLQCCLVRSLQRLGNSLCSFKLLKCCSESDQCTCHFTNMSAFLMIFEMFKKRCGTLWS